MVWPALAPLFSAHFEKTAYMFFVRRSFLKMGVLKTKTWDICWKVDGWKFCNIDKSIAMLNTVAISLSTTQNRDLYWFFFRSFCLDTKRTKKSRTPQGFPKNFSSSAKCGWHQGLEEGFYLRITPVAQLRGVRLLPGGSIGVFSRISRSLKLMKNF